MVTEAVGNLLVPFGGSALVGYVMGFAIRKIMRLVITVIGVALGLFFVGLYYLQSRGYIPAPGVDWNKVGNDIVNSTQQYWGNAQSLASVHTIIHQLGAPVSSGLAMGMLIGFARTR
jgi:uncharacterized membrane protein (Fun14 family)